MTPTVGIIIYQSRLKIHRPLWCQAGWRWEEGDERVRVPSKPCQAPRRAESVESLPPKVFDTWDATLDRSARPPQNELCKNYSVIITRLWRFNHTRPPALSRTCSPTPQPQVERSLIKTYVSICTIKPVQNVSRETLYIQLGSCRIVGLSARRGRRESCRAAGMRHCGCRAAARKLLSCKSLQSNTGSRPA